MSRNAHVSLARRVRRRLVEVRDRLDRRPLHRVGRRLPAPGRDLLAAVEAALDERTLRRLAVIAADRPAETGAAFARRYPHARIVVLDAGRAGGPRRSRPRPRVSVVRAASVEAMHNALSEVAGLQAVVDLGPTDRALRTGAFRRLLFHLDDGGSYLVADTDAEPGSRAGRGPDVRDVVARLLRIKADESVMEREQIHEDERHRARAIRSVTRDRGLIVIGKGGRHAVKLRDDVATPVLRARHGAGRCRELDRREPVTIDARGSVHTNDDERRDSFRTTLSAPRLYLREYRDVVCAPRQLAVQGDVILPISFHHGLRKRLQQASPLVEHSDAAFAVLDPALRRAPRLEGTYFHLDSEFPGHFGHLITEDISKLWGWPAARAAHPELKVLLSTARLGGAPGRAHLALLAAWGVPAEDVVCIDAPVRVETLVGASPMFYNGVYAHPELSGIWDRLRDALRARDAAPTPRRIFVTRARGSLRPCRNAGDVEALFSEHGFAVVRPEQLSTAEQVTLFAGADVVAGFGGSGLFNTVFSDHPGRRIVLASTEYSARNEWTIAALKGDDYHHFFCPAETRSADGRWESKAFHSAFSFDFARDGAALKALLSE